MELRLLGTGCPSVDYKRFGSANIVSTRHSKILVDCGSGVTQRLNEANISSANIDALFLTHLHSDHVVDLYQLIISSWHSYRVNPWKIFGPKGSGTFFFKFRLGLPGDNLFTSLAIFRDFLKEPPKNAYPKHLFDNISIFSPLQ